MRLRKGRGRVKLRLTGRLTAAVTQQCVVTLDPAPAEIDEDFEILYGAPEDDRDIDLAPTAEQDELEPLTGDTLDIGEAVAQELALNLDPYPRAPGVPEAPDDVSAAPAGEKSPARRPDNPFAALKKTLPPRR